VPVARRAGWREIPPAGSPVFESFVGVELTGPPVAAE